MLTKKFNPEELTGRIVLLGYLGDYLSDKRMDQMWYSPLNKNPLGKSLPDMYSLVVHANIIRMIIQGDWINKMSDGTSSLISVIIVLLNIWFFIWLEHKKAIWSEVFVISVPAAQIIFLALLRYFMFSEYNYIIDLSSAAVLLVSVSLSTTLYFGPILHSVKRIKSAVRK